MIEINPFFCFDEIYIISDLHLGGPEEAQVFNQGENLALMIEKLTQKPNNRKIGLIINGDVIDFLAQPSQKVIDPLEAVHKINIIFSYKELAFFIDNLKRFVESKNCYLIINMGNHDVEIALPWVKEALIKNLSNDNEDYSGKIRIITDGTGILCQVGKARVLCLHGNEMDPWNYIDYEALRRYCRDFQRDEIPGAWKPDAGTKMVVNVLNNIKEDFPFVDLLKPEQKAVLPILLVLDPNQLNKIKEIPGIATTLAWDRLRRLTGFLAADEEAMEDSPLEEPTSPEYQLDLLLRKTLQIEKDDIKTLLLEVEEDFQEHKNVRDIITGEQGEEFLGFNIISYWWNRIIRRKGKEESLRLSLKELINDHSFEIDHEDSYYKQFDDAVGGEIDFLVVGHTHLERAIPRRKGTGIYFNSGTWMRLIKLRSDILEDSKKFKKTFNTFKKSLKDLDSVPDLILIRPTVVTIQEEKGIVKGALQHFEKGEFVPANPKKTCEFTRS